MHRKGSSFVQALVNLLAVPRGCCTVFQTRVIFTDFSSVVSIFELVFVSLWRQKGVTSWQLVR